MSTVLISGSSTGIGQACALRLDRGGHRVFAGIRRDVDAKRLKEQASDRLRPVLLDVTDEAQVEAVMKLIGEESGVLHGVVNNAGIARGGPLEYLPLELWREQLEVNVIGQVALTRAALPLLRASKGRVVFIGSVGGKVATALMGPYNASKFAVEAIGESLRHELHPWDIGVAVVEPGAIKTAIWEKGRREADRLEGELPAKARELYADHLIAIRKGIDMQDRQGIQPDKVARAVEHALFSKHPRTRYLVGIDAKLQGALVRVLPDRAREAIIRKFAGP